MYREFNPAINNQKQSKKMETELEHLIARKKRELEDYIRIAPYLGKSNEETDKMVDTLLEDLSKLMKKRK